MLTFDKKSGRVAKQEMNRAEEHRSPIFYWTENEPIILSLVFYKMRIENTLHTRTPAKIPFSVLIVYFSIFNRNNK